MKPLPNWKWKHHFTREAEGSYMYKFALKTLQLATQFKILSEF